MITPTTEKFSWQFATMGDPMLEKMLRAATEFASAVQLRQEPRWLSLLGSSGAGKTHLAKALLRFWRERGGWQVVHGRAGDFQTLGSSAFISWRKFLDRQRSGEFSEIRSLRETDFVVIDDIGAEHDPSGFAKSRLDDIVDARLGKWTVITSNLLLPQVATIDVRISSRLIRGGSTVLEINAPDFNLRKPKQ